MAKKYVKDYRLTDSVDTRGKLCTETEYIGGQFYFQQGAAAVRARAKVLAGFNAAAWAAWLTPLLFNNGAMHIAFISFPYLFAPLPLWLMSMAVYTALTTPEPMKHKQSDRVCNLLPGGSIAAAILSGIALIGLGISLIFHIGTHNSFDWLFGICAALLLAAVLVIFSQRKFFRTEEH